MSVPRLLLALVAVFGSWFGGAGTASAQADPPPRLECTTVQEPTNFDTYWAGPSFDGLPLTAVIRECNPPPAGDGGRTNHVIYIYGDCTPRGGGCAPPVQIHTSPSADRNRAMYDKGPEEFRLTPEDTTVGGFPAARFEGGARLEIYRPDVTVVIFAGGRERVDRFAAAVRPGPKVLTEVARYDLVFPDDCLDDTYCTAEPFGEALAREALPVFPFLIPATGFLVALLFGRWWALLVPVIGWPLVFAASYAGWWGGGLGELWQLALMFMILVGVAAVGAGLLLRAIVRNRRRPLSADA